MKIFNFYNENLKRNFTMLFGFQFILIIIVAFLILFLSQNQNNLAKSRDVQYESYQLADELRQSSDDLTRLVRTYVATGNSEFEREYWAVLDIRNGKIPRPLDYNNIYWDFFSADGKKPRGDGPAISLDKLMVQKGFTNAEFEKLALAQKNSDSIVRAETVAMNAMKGLFEDRQGNFTVKGEPNQKMASELVNNEAYHKAKAEIMRPINDFYLMFEERTASTVAKYLNISKTLFLLLGIIIIFIIVISFYAFFIVRKQIVEREATEKKNIELAESLDKEIKEKAELGSNLDKIIKEKTVKTENLDKMIKERTKKLELSEIELKKQLGESEKINKLMVNRELKMIELKKEIEYLREKENRKS